MILFLNQIYYQLINLKFCNLVYYQFVLNVLGNNLNKLHLFNHNFIFLNIFQFLISFLYLFLIDVFIRLNVNFFWLNPHFIFFKFTEYPTALHFLLTNKYFHFLNQLIIFYYLN